MSAAQELQPFVAASISDWEWTIPDWLTFGDENPPGHVTSSPERRFSVMGQEYVFAYQLTLPHDWGWNHVPTTRLMNLSGTDVRIKSHRHPDRTYTLKPGEGCTQATSFVIRFGNNGTPVGLVENDALIELDYDFAEDSDFISLLKDPKDTTDFKLLCEGKVFPCQ